MHDSRPTAKLLGVTPSLFLHLVRSGNVNGVRTVLQQHPELVCAGVLTYYGWTPLHQAAAIGDKQMVRLFLTNQADVNARDNTGGTPLHYAADRGHKKLVAMFLAIRAD